MSISGSILLSGEVLWDRIRKNYQFDYKTTDPKVQYYVKQFSNNAYLSQITQRSAPYLYLVVEALERRDLPGELALLPIVESAYDPTARSEKGAAGIWQMMPHTAKRFGLKRDHWYDGRMDVAASTEAALDYLDYLKDRFEEDWLLALAAYNSGEGKVSRSMQRNRQREQSTEFWALGLPRQTRDYVPKILALAEITRDPKGYGVELPEIYNEPYLAGVQLDTPLAFNEAAKFAGMSLKELKKLNAGYHKATYHPNSAAILLMPIANATHFLEKAGEHLPSVRLASLSKDRKNTAFYAMDLVLKLRKWLFPDR